MSPLGVRGLVESTARHVRAVKASVARAVLSRLPSDVDATRARLTCYASALDPPRGLDEAMTCERDGLRVEMLWAT